MQRSIEAVIGRLVTDEKFRRRFMTDPHQALVDLHERGTHLTHTEIAALIAPDVLLWDRVAEASIPGCRRPA
jgi:hypothetical protein